MKYAWIQQHSSLYPVQVMCSVLSVPRSGYYAWLREPESPQARKNRIIALSVKSIFEETEGIAGSVYIANELKKHDKYPNASRSTVQRIMWRERLRSRSQRKRKVVPKGTETCKNPKSNLLDQNFTTYFPNDIWVGDITEFETKEGKCYLSAVLDLFNRKIIGWSLMDHRKTALVTESLQNALHTRATPPQIFHSDQGVQYGSNELCAMLKRNAIRQSMSGKGNCYDNAVIERFFCALKNEWVKHYTYETIEQARRSVWYYIEVFYNRKRGHTYLGHLSPVEFENLYMKRQAA